MAMDVIAPAVEHVAVGASIPGTYVATTKNVKIKAQMVSGVLNTMSAGSWHKCSKSAEYIGTVTLTSSHFPHCPVTTWFAQ